MIVEALMAAAPMAIDRSKPQGIQRPHPEMPKDETGPRLLCHLGGVWTICVPDVARFKPGDHPIPERG